MLRYCIDYSVTVMKVEVMVKQARTYVSGRRAEQAAETRRAIVAAAQETFSARGWQATTIAGVAKVAGVSAETVYAVFGTKPALLAAAIESVVRGSEPQTPLIEQAGPRAVAAAAEPRRALHIFANDIARILAQTARLMAVARSAAETDTSLRETYLKLQRGRRANLSLVAAALQRLGALRAGLSAADALDTIWRLASPELFVLMTEVEGLSLPRYARWLETALTRLLLADA